MNAEVLFYHLMQLGADVQLSADARGLEIDAPREALTPEMMELLREHKSELIEIFYLCEEREAIAAEGCEGERPPCSVQFEGEAFLVERVRNAPAVRALVDFLDRRDGGVIEVVQAQRQAA